MLPEHLRNLVAAHMPVIALAEAGPIAADLTNAPYLDHWIAMQEFTGRIVLSGDVTGHPLLRNTGIVTSQLFGIDTKAGWARTLSRWYRLGRPLAPDKRSYPTRSVSARWRIQMFWPQPWPHTRTRSAASPRRRAINEHPDHRRSAPRPLGPSGA